MSEQHVHVFDQCSTCGALHEHCEKESVDAAPAPTPEGCDYIEINSRVCERGTKGCSVMHEQAGAPASAPLKCDCWIGRGDWGGNSDERERCPIHGLKAASAPPDGIVPIIHLPQLVQRLRELAAEQNTRQQVVYGAADIREAVKREDVLLSAASAIGQLSEERDALQRREAALRELADKWERRASEPYGDLKAYRGCANELRAALASPDPLQKEKRKIL